MQKCTMLSAAILMCTLANADDYSEKIRETKEQCIKILDDMFFTDQNFPWDTSVEGNVRASEKIMYADVSTTGWWIGHRKNRIQGRISDLKNDIRENGSEKKLNDEDGCGKRIKYIVKKQLRKVDYLMRKNEIDAKVNAAEDEILRSVEMRIEENTKKLMSLIPHNVSDETIEMNYNQLVTLPSLLCYNDLKAKESDCEEVYRKMLKFAGEIMVQRRESESAEK